MSSNNKIIIYSHRAGFALFREGFGKNKNAICLQTPSVKVPHHAVPGHEVPGHLELGVLKILVREHEAVQGFHES